MLTQQMSSYAIPDHSRPEQLVTTKLQKVQPGTRLRKLNQIKKLQKVQSGTRLRKLNQIKELQKVQLINI